MVVSFEELGESRCDQVEVGLPHRCRQARRRAQRKQDAGIEEISVYVDADEADGVEARILNAVTRAFPVVAGETWTSRLEGLPLPGMRLAFR